MKNQLLIILLLILGGYSQPCKSQEKLQPLKEFGNDTMAYMKKNYDGRALYRNNKTIGDVLADAEIPFKSYFLAESTEFYSSIGFILLFTKPANEVKALYKAGKPVYGVFCDFEDSYSARRPGGNNYENMLRFGTNQFNDLKKNAAKTLKDIKINWADFYDQKEWFEIYKVK